MTVEFYNSHVNETLLLGGEASERWVRTAALVAHGVRGVLVPSVNLSDCTDLPSEVARLAQVPGLKFAGFALGLHPWELVSLAPEGDDALAQALASCVGRSVEGGQPLWAIGECGLDTGRRFAPRTRQLAWVARHVALARRFERPLVLHAVGGHQALLSLLDELRAPPSIVHGFTGAPEMALAYVRRGHHVGFGRALLDPRATRARASAVAVPEHALLIETDTPERPMSARQPPEDAASLPDVARALAALRGVTVEHVAACTWENTVRALQLGGHA